MADCLLKEKQHIFEEVGFKLIQWMEMKDDFFIERRLPIVIEELFDEVLLKKESTFGKRVYRYLA